MTGTRSFAGYIVNVFDPELVVLGGSLARMHPLVEAPLDTELHRRAFYLVLSWQQR